MTGLRRRFRFGLKSLLVFVTLICILLALVTEPIVEARRQWNLLAHVSTLGGKISNLGSISRKLSPGRFILAQFSTAYDRFPLYGLDFSGTKLSDADLEQVSRLTHIKELNLSGTRISDAGLRHLRNLEFLTRLDLSGTHVTDQAVADLQRMKVLASLNTVRTSLSYDALEELDAKLPYAHFCEERAIDELKAAGIQVVDWPRFLDGDPSRGCWTIQAGREAVDVCVGMNRQITLTTRDVVNLGYLQSLRKMTFHTVTLGPDGLSSLRPLKNLKNLEIWYVNLSERDLNILAQQTQLERLTICGCDLVSDEGVAQLKALTNLKRLHIESKGVSRVAIATLRKELPSCAIIFSPY